MGVVRRMLAVVTIALLFVLPARAQTPGPSLEHDRIEALWTQGPQPDWFAPRFLAAIPYGQIGPLLKTLATPMGAYRSTSGANGVFVSHFEKGTIEVRIHIDSQKQIDGLRLLPPEITAATTDRDVTDVGAPLRALAGSVEYVLMVGNEERDGVRADAFQAVGSAFKLAVLNALRDEVDAGRLHWTDVVPLDPKWKSLPSGVLQTWPDQTPITLATYAAQMISISDNTAADALAAIVGPAAIARYASRNLPFLTTRELFALRTHAQQMAMWRAGDRAAREAMLPALAALPLPELAEFKPELGDRGVEWLYTPKELCSLMDRVADLPALRINPGVANPAAFARVAFKGGSEVGVYAMVTSVITKKGTHACLAITENSAGPIDEQAFQSAASSYLAVIAGM